MNLLFFDKKIVFFGWRCKRQILILKKFRRNWNSNFGILHKTRSTWFTENWSFVGTLNFISDFSDLFVLSDMLKNYLFSNLSFWFFHRQWLKRGWFGMFSKLERVLSERLSLFSCPRHWSCWSVCLELPTWPKWQIQSNPPRRPLTRAQWYSMITYPTIWKL